MLENIATAIIICFSSILFAWWFRYACLLILRAQPARNCTREVIEANQLCFEEVCLALGSKSATSDLAELMSTLDRDYRRLVYLLKFGDAPLSRQPVVERRMLQIYYQVLVVWCSCTRGAARSLARHAVEEMTLVVAHLAASLGEQRVNRYLASGRI